MVEREAPSSAQLGSAAALFLVFVAAAGVGVRNLQVDFDLERMYAAFAEQEALETAQLMLAVAPDHAEARTRALRAIPGVLEVRSPAVDPALLDSIPAAQRAQAEHAFRGKPATDVVPIGITVRASSPPLDAIQALGPEPLVGTPVMNRAHAASAKAAQVHILVLLALGLGGALLLVLRRVVDTLLVLGSVAAGGLALAGTLGWLGLPLGGPNLLLLPLLAVLGFADTLHLLRQASSTQALSLEPRARAAWALRQSLWPCALTSMTTALAFLALLTSDAAVIRQFGALAAYGMALALVSGLLLPAAVLTLSPSPGPRTTATAWSERCAAVHFPRWVLAGVLVFAIPASWVTVDLKLGGELADGDPDLAAQQAMDTALGGVFPLVLRLETDLPDGTAHPDAAMRLLQLQRRLDQDPAVGAVSSYADALAWIAAGRGARPEDLVERRGDPARREARFTRVHTRALEAGADATAVPLFDDDRSAYLIYVRYRDHGARAWSRTIDFLEGFNRTAPEVRLEMHGYVPLAVHTLHRIPTEATRVVGLTLLSALLVVAFRHRDLRATLGVIPILLGTVLAALGTMGLLGQPLNHTNLFVLSLAVGLGVDAWLHLQAHGRAHAGPAILWTTFVLSVGFVVLQASELRTIRQIGLVLLVATLTNTLLSLGLYPLTARTPGS